MQSKPETPRVTAVSTFTPPATAPAAPLAISINHAVALTFASTGLPVFPCDPATKAPLTSRGFHDATTDLRQIRRWWRQHPGALVGLPTSHFWVLDIDAKPSLADSVSRLLGVVGFDRAALAASCSLVVATPGGGRHLYFARLPGVAIRTTAGDIAPGIDTRGHDADGKPTGYIIAPGCILPDGRQYRIVKGSLEALFTIGGRT